MFSNICFTDILMNFLKTSLLHPVSFQGFLPPEDQIIGGHFFHLGQRPVEDGSNIGHQARGHFPVYRPRALEKPDMISDIASRSA